QDDDPLTYTAVGLPLGVSVDPATGVISGTITRPGAGLHRVTLSVSDGSLSASATFLWFVALANGIIPIRRHEDFGGDGRADLVALAGDVSDQWRVLTSSTNFTSQLLFGTGSSSSTSPSVLGDYDGDGKPDPGFYNPPSGFWSVKLSSTNYTTSLS